jgi:hypothetical protein
VPDAIFCPRCRDHHRAEVALDVTGWPTTRWIDGHRDDLAEAIDRLGQAAGEAFAIATSKGDLWAAEGFVGAALDRNDPEEGRS